MPSLRILAASVVVTLTAGLVAVSSPLPESAVVSGGAALQVGPASVRGNWPTTTTIPPPPRRSPPARAARSRPVRAPNAATYPAGVEQWRSLVASFPGWDVNAALRIMRCESGGNPNARNRRSSATGLFQILRGSTDPVANVRQAHAMWRSRGWQPWRACAHAL